MIKAPRRLRDAAVILQSEMNRAYLAGWDNDRLCIHLSKYDTYCSTVSEQDCLPLAQHDREVDSRLLLCYQRLSM